MKYLQTNFGFFGNPTADRNLDPDHQTLTVTVTLEDKSRHFELPLTTIRLELHTLQHEIRGD